MTHAYSTLRLLRTAPLSLLVLALAACSAGADDPAPGSEQVAMSAETAPAVVQGLGGDPGQPIVGDTIDLRKIGYSRGAEDAPVTVYEFSDFGCPFCASFARGTYPQLHEEFVETGKVRWTYVPFVMGMFPNGAEAARAAECAAEQERFWEMHDLLFEKQREWKASRAPTTLFEDFAATLNLDESRFASCYREDRGSARTAVNNRAAQSLRVRATPSFFVNGRLVEGALPAEQFRAVLTQLSNR